MLHGLQLKLLRRISPSGPSSLSGAAYASKSKLEILLGKEFLRSMVGKTVIDFGCGEGAEAIDLALQGARCVIGIDIREDLLELARQRALVAGVHHLCRFSTCATELADIIVSLDAFEHFDNPAEILRTMYTLLKPQGEVVASFGPTWYHPLGGHLFSVFPWAHLIFSEKALIEWRSGFKSDGARTFSEVAGGLNQMTIRGFERIIAASPFCLSKLDLVPIRKVRLLHNRWTREFTTAVVRCRLVKKPSRSSEISPAA